MQEYERRLSEEERRNDGKKQAVSWLCPGLPSPSGVHLLTHPSHRAEYTGGREGPRKRGTE